MLEFTVNRDYQFSFTTNSIPAGSRPWAINYVHNLMRSIDKTQIYDIDQCLFSSRLCHPPIHYVISLSIFVSRWRKTNYLHNKFCENENVWNFVFLIFETLQKKYFFFVGMLSVLTFDGLNDASNGIAQWRCHPLSQQLLLPNYVIINQRALDTNFYLAIISFAGKMNLKLFLIISIHTNEFSFYISQRFTGSRLAR